MPGKMLPEKIKNYRRRADLSQLEVENEISASPGSISRIESGKVNPTKETLQQISKALNLTQKESVDLLDLASLHPSEDEIKSAIEEVKDFFEGKGNLGYLLDDWWILHAVSPALIGFLGFIDDDLDKIIGANIIQIMLDPKYGIRKIIDPEKIVDVFGLELARAKAELNEDQFGNYFEKLAESLKSTPAFDKIQEKGKEFDKEIIRAGTRRSHLVINGQKVSLFHMREKLKKNPRFELVEFVFAA